MKRRDPSACDKSTAHTPARRALASLEDEVDAIYV